MDIKNHKGNIEVKNISGGRIALGRLAVKHGESKIINPALYHETVSNALESMLLRGVIEIKHVDKIEKQVKIDSNVVKKETIKNDKDEKNEHTIFDPETARKERAIKVDSIVDNNKAIEVSFSQLDKADAEDFLAQHWKKIEKELQNVKSTKRLEFILSIANELGMNGNKKCELIEDRITELKS